VCRHSQDDVNHRGGIAVNPISTSRTTVLTIIACLALASMAIGQTTPVAPLESLKTAYSNAVAKIAADTRRQRDDAQIQYAKNLIAVQAAHKQKGDIDGYTVVDHELKRFQTDKTVLTNNPGILISDAVDAYQKQVAAVETEAARRNADLLKRYVAALGNLVKDLMARDKMAEAKAVGDEKKATEFILAELETGLPEVKANLEVRVVDPVKPDEVKSVVGKWHLYRPDGTPDVGVGTDAEVYRDGRFVVVGLDDWSGFYSFTDMERTKIRRTCKNGQTRIGTYDKVTDTITWTDGYTYRRATESSSSKAPPPAGVTPLSASGSFADVVGKWKVSYDNGFSRTIQIDKKGHVTVLEASWPCVGIMFDTVWDKAAKKYVAKAADLGMAETYRVVEEKMSVERWSAAQYPKGAPANLGTGVRVTD